MVDGGPALKSTPTKSIAGRTNDNLVAAVTQDLMCKPFILHKTGLTIEDHQKITVCRYARLLDLTNVYIMPVLQGYSPDLTPLTLIATANS